MGETTTTTTSTTKAPETPEATPTTTQAPEPTTTTTTTQKPSEASEKADEKAGLPSREESLKAAGKASPHAPDAGIKDGTPVLGQENQTSDERLDDARREGLQNAQGEQDLKA